MDQDTARVLFQEGAILVFLDVPVGTEFGIDYNSWNVGSQFRGVKMIPPGMHFVYYSACDKEGQTAPRTGFFHNFKKKEILVKKWDKLTEDITEYEGDNDEVMQRFYDNREDMDRFLGAYPYENYKKWVSLSDYITPDLAKQLQPENGKIVSVCDFISEKSNSKSRDEKSTPDSVVTDKVPENMKEAQARLPDMVIRPGTAIRFSDIPKHKYPPGSSPQEITKYSMDSTYTLTQLITQCYSADSNKILGELQFAFVCFIVGQVYDAFEQWKKLVHLLCSSEEAVIKQKELYLNFIKVLHFQVKEIPSDFFVDIVSQNNFLTSTLKEFFTNLQSEGVDKVLASRGLKFRQHLTNMFKWDFTEDPDEFAPVVVDLSA